MLSIFEQVGSVAQFIGSLTVVGGALMWMYNKFIGIPREKKRQQAANNRQTDMINLITERNEPLNKAIQSMTEMLSESKLDRQQLNQIAKVNTGIIDIHEQRLDNHNDRLIVLETKNGIQTITYKDHHKKEDKHEQLDTDE